MAPYTLGLVGAIVTLAFVFELLRRRHLREKYAVLWVAIGVGGLLLSLFPVALTKLSELVGVELPSNLLFFGALFILLLMNVQHSFEVGRLEERTRTLAEEVALLRLEQQREGVDDDR